MVIVYSKTLEKKKGVNDVSSEEANSHQGQLQTMSRGTTLLLCGTVEADRWLELGQSCPFPRMPVESSLEELWDILPKHCQGNSVPGRDTAATSSITSQIQDLSLGEGNTGPAPSPFISTKTALSKAPPPKRQCRSLSFSDELGGYRSAWRPQGSRVWTSVEKRRCHSGGSVQRCSGAALSTLGDFPAMQRSSSFSLPTDSSTLGLELPCFSQHLTCPVTIRQPSALLRPLSLSHEQINLSEPSQTPTSPDFSPELESCVGPGGLSSGGWHCVASGGLSRSHSQPCALNDKKTSMKRRRPEDPQEPRPSLDLTKMTQKRQTFHSLSCPGISWLDSCQSSHEPSLFKSNRHSEASFTSASDLEGESAQEVRDDSLFEDSSCSVDSRAGSPGGLDRRLPGTEAEVYQLGGELDIDQIERN